MYSTAYRGKDIAVAEELQALTGELFGLQPTVKYQASVEVIPLSPDSKQTIVFFTGLTAPITLNDLRDGRAGDRIILVNESTHNVTLTGSNAKLSGGANWVGAQYDTITLIFSGLSGFWLELARSANI